MSSTMLRKRSGRSAITKGTGVSIAHNAMHSKNTVSLTSIASSTPIDDKLNELGDPKKLSEFIGEVLGQKSDINIQPEPQEWLKTLTVFGGCDVPLYNNSMSLPLKKKYLAHMVNQVKITMARIEKLADAPPDVQSSLYGSIDFIGNTNQSPYICLKRQPDSDTQGTSVYAELISVMVERMGIRPPRLIISMIGSMDDESLESEPLYDKLKDVLRNALGETPDAWILTNGLNGGVSKMVASIMAGVRNSRSPVDEYALPVIGILPWQQHIQDPTSQVHMQKNALFTDGPGVYVPYSAQEYWNLEKHHTFYVFVDNPRDDFQDVLFRRELISYVRNQPFEYFKHMRARYMRSRFPRHATDNAGDAALLQNASLGAFDDANQNDHFVELTTQIGVIDMVIGGDIGDKYRRSERNMLLCEWAVTRKHNSPLVVINGTGGLADLIAYAYRFQHDSSPMVTTYNANFLEAQVRELYEIFDSNKVSNRHKRIVNVVAVARKIIAFDLEASDGSDLDKAMLQALIQNMQSNLDYAEEEFVRQQSSDLNRIINSDTVDAQIIYKQYELHLNILRYAMGFDRVEAAEIEVGKLDALYDNLVKICRKHKLRATQSTGDGLQWSDRELLTWAKDKQIGILYTNSDPSEPATNAHEQTLGPRNPNRKSEPLQLTLHDQYKLALEWGLAENKVALVKFLIKKLSVPKKDGRRGGIAEFLYGTHASRPGEGYGTSLAELYEYESRKAKEKVYLREILPIEEHHKDIGKPFYKDLKVQMGNNLKVRKVWSLVLQYTKKNPHQVAPMWNPTAFGGTASYDGSICLYPEPDATQFKFDEDGYLIEEFDNIPQHDIRALIAKRYDSEYGDPSHYMESELKKDRTLETVYFSLFDRNKLGRIQFQTGVDAKFTENKPFEDRELIAFQELTIWAVIMDRAELAEYFWQMGGHSIPNALIASAICTGISSQLTSLNKGKLEVTIESMNAMASKFEQHAIGVLDRCFRLDQAKTQQVIETKLDAYDWLTGMDSMELAELGDNMDFIGSPAAQAVIERSWAHGKTITEQINKEVYGSGRTFKKTLVDKLSAPRFKFVGEVLSYCVLVVLLTIISIRNPTTDFSSLEIVVLLWMTSLCVDEVRQLLGPVFLENRPLLLQLGDHFFSREDGLWNGIDSLLYVCYWWATGMRLGAVSDSFHVYANSQGHHDAERVTKALYGFCTLLLYMRMLRFTLIFRDFGPKVLIFVSLFNNLIPYLGLLMVFVLGFGVYLQAMLRPNYVEHYDTYTLGHALYRIVYRPYFQVYGELMLDDMNAESSCKGPDPFTNCDSWVDLSVPIITGVYLILTSVMILNMLIADFTRTFDMIYDDSQKHWRMSWYHLYVEQKDRAILPPPFSFLVNFIQGIIWMVRRCFEREYDGQQAVSLVLEDRINAIEVFQDNQTDEYLADYNERSKQGDVLSRIEKALESSKVEIQFFKAQTFAANKKSEFRTKDVSNTANKLNFDGRKSSYATFISNHIDRVLNKGTDGMLYVDGFLNYLEVPQENSPPNRGTVDGDANSSLLFDETIQAVMKQMSTHEQALLLNLTSDHEIEYSSKLQSFSEKLKSLWERSLLYQPGWEAGPNRRVLHLVTRWKRDEAGIRINRFGKPLLEFIAVKRGDSSSFWSIPEMATEIDVNIESDWAIQTSPVLSQALHRKNFKEHVNRKNQEHVLRLLDTTIFKKQLTPLEYPRLDDPRNTGMGWMHAVMYHFHEQDFANLYDSFDLRHPGEGVSEVAWLTVHRTMDLAGDQEHLLHECAEVLQAHW
eukprot:m.236147 g.236147  ORF g.236147 m.236147 type:complete len:1778 (-) comp33676_c0_seq2:70-5403(-)